MIISASTPLLRHRIRLLAWGIYRHALLIFATKINQVYDQPMHLYPLNKLGDFRKWRIESISHADYFSFESTQNQLKEQDIRKKMNCNRILLLEDMYLPEHWECIKRESSFSISATFSVTAISM